MVAEYRCLSFTCSQRNKLNGHGNDNGITKASPLSFGQTPSSSNGVCELGFFSPNNSRNQYVGIWFKGIIPRVVVWVANREKPVIDSTANLGISSNGSLLLSNGKHGVVWSTGEIFASNGSRAELTDYENLVFIDKASGRTLWQSFEHLGNTLLPTSTMMYNLVTGENRGLSSWKSYTDPSPGEFVGQITPQVPSQGIIMRGSSPYYRTGPWDKTRDYKLARMILTSEGSMKVLQHNGMDWESSYEGPANSCDIYGVCGPSGFCVISDPPKCKCFKGFVPKSIEEWKRGNWTSGCARRTELHCQGNSTGKDANVFHTVPNIKPPDFYEYANSQNAEEWPPQLFLLGLCLYSWNRVLNVEHGPNGHNAIFCRRRTSFHSSCSF
ncbi:unnamed protein product [Arabidopsis halleri]